MEAVDKESDMEPQFLSAVTSHNFMRTNESDVRFQLDTADVNTICAKFVKKHQLLPSKQKPTMWNGSTMRPLGEAVLDVVNPKKEQSAAVHFTVVDNGYTCLLGVNTIQALGLVTINKHVFIASDTKESLWDLGEAKLRINPDHVPASSPAVEYRLLFKKRCVSRSTNWLREASLSELKNPQHGSARWLSHGRNQMDSWEFVLTPSHWMQCWGVNISKRQPWMMVCPASTTLESSQSLMWKKLSGMCV